MIRVLLVHDIRLISDVIAALLEGVPDIEAAGSATTVEEALERLPGCDVVLVNARLPDDGAVRLAQAAAAAHPAAKVLVLGLTETKERVLKYVEAGAAGYVLKEDSVEDLLERIRIAHGGAALVSPEVAAALMSRLAELAQSAPAPEPPAPAPADSSELTPREREILELVGQGCTNQQIAERLVIEVGTVKNHVHSILQKLNVSSRQDAAAQVSGDRR